MMPVDTKIRDGVFTITLSRPKQFNALNLEMLNQLMEVVSLIEENCAVRCVVIEGAGDNFMAGGDIAYFYQLVDADIKEKEQKFSSMITEVHQLIEKLANLSVPVVAKIRGAAAGFGISLVAGCDLAYGAKSSFYTSAYHALGTSPDGGSTYFIPRVAGMKKAMEVMLTAKRYSAEQAVELGLINSAVDDEQLDSIVTEVAQQITNSARIAVANTKKLIRLSFQNNLHEQLLCEQKFFLECAISNDFTEGIRAFVEKRTANFE